MNVLQRLADCLREQRIRDLQARINAEPNHAIKRLWLLDLRDEINARSPDQVRRMEQALGLPR